MNKRIFFLLIGLLSCGGAAVAQSTMPGVGAPNMQVLYAKAETGDVDAYRTLGDLYLSGYTVEKNYGEALKWYRKGAEKEDVQSEKMLGDMYLFGLGTFKNPNEAAKWYQKAADKGDKSAKDKLAQLQAK